MNQSWHIYRLSLPSRKAWISAVFGGTAKKNDPPHKKVLDLLLSLGQKTLAWRYVRRAPPHNPDLSMALARGSVVRLRPKGAGSQGLVWRVDGDTLVLISISGTNGPPRHRAEVVISDLSDIMATGISLTWPTIRCHVMFRVATAKLFSQEPTGRAPDRLMARVVAAVQREIEARRLEDRGSFRGLREAWA